MKNDYYVWRSSASIKLFDIIACNKQHFLLENIKSTKQKYYSYVKEMKFVKEFNDAPPGTLKKFILYQKGKRKVLYEGMI